MTPRLSLHLVTWNSRRYLDQWLASIEQQTIRPQLQVIVVDNASTDGSRDWLTAQPSLQVIQNQTNRGYAGAHNQAITASTAPFHLIMNPDVILDRRFCEKLLTAFADPTVGSAGGKVYQLDAWPSSSSQPVQTRTIDTAGIRRRLWGSWVDRGNGEPDHGQYDQSQQVFGISGALVAFRRQALDDIQWNTEYFDEDFHSYKEDVDLAYRLQHHGWHAQYVPSAMAYHQRHVSSRNSHLSRVRQRSSAIAVQSYTNHLFVSLKNDRWTYLLSHSLFLLVYEVAKALSLLILRPMVFFHSLQRLGQILPHLWPKRRFILHS